MSKLLVATGNQGKLVEIGALLKDLGLDIELTTPTLLGIDLEVEENGQTYLENAVIKGMAFARASGLPTLADDSGLEVDALNGLPGIRSHRFVPLAGATDADRRAFLLQKLQGLPRPWTARFCCAVALVEPGEEGVQEGVQEGGDVRVQTAEGECRGEIIPEERGQNGFGYDPVFFFPALGRTMAELDLQMKNQISHRARAVQAARPILIEIFKNRT